MSYGYSARLIALNKEADSKLLGVKLGRICIKRNIPVSLVASELGVSRQTVYNWFTGANTPLNQSVGAVQTLLKSFT
jgi:transcriptional regulator with XRE-family HTH domain